MSNLKRNIQMKFRVTPEERKLIEQKMANCRLNELAHICGKWRLMDISFIPICPRSRSFKRSFKQSDEI